MYSPKSRLKKQLVAGQAAQVGAHQCGVNFGCLGLGTAIVRESPRGAVEFRYASQDAGGGRPGELSPGQHRREVENMSASLSRSLKRSGHRPSLVGCRQHQKVVVGQARQRYLEGLAIGGDRHLRHRTKIGQLPGGAGLTQKG